MTLGERIRETRKKHGLSQKELGKLIGVSGSMIGQYETEQRKPKITTIMRIASVLGIEWTDIVPEFAGLEQIDKYTWGKEAGAEVYRRIEENYQQHHGAQSRANAAMNQMSEEGRNKVADYAEDILPRYRTETTPQSPLRPQVGEDTTPPPDAPETPPEGK